MAKITVEANQCDVCGHVWLPSGKPAVQCAKCRTRKWNAGPGKLSRPWSPGERPNIAAIQAFTEKFVAERTVEYEE